MRWIGSDIIDRQRANLIELHRAIANEPLMLRRNLASSILELPWRIGEDSAEPFAPYGANQIISGGKRTVSREHEGT